MLQLFIPVHTHPKCSLPKLDISKVFCHVLVGIPRSPIFHVLCQQQLLALRFKNLADRKAFVHAFLCCLQSSTSMLSAIINFTTTNSQTVYDGLIFSSPF